MYIFFVYMEETSYEKSVRPARAWYLMGGNPIRQGANHTTGSESWAGTSNDGNHHRHSWIWTASWVPFHQRIWLMQNGLVWQWRCLRKLWGCTSLHKSLIPVSTKLTLMSANDYHRRLDWNKNSGTDAPSHPADKQFR